MDVVNLNQATGYVAPKTISTETQNPTPALGASFGDVLSGTSAQTNTAATAVQLLTTAESSRANRPNVKEFMDRTGAQFADASELIYGVVGSNTDVRDWSAIMASADPVSAARQATGQMYAKSDTPVREDATYLAPGDTLAKSGNFAVRLETSPDTGKVVDSGVKLVDAQGMILRDAGSSAEAIARNAWLFGFDNAPLAKLADAAASISPELKTAVIAASNITLSSTPPSPAASMQAAADTTASAPAIAALKQQPQMSAAALTTPTLEELINPQATNTAAPFIDSMSYLSGFLKAVS